MMVRDAILAEVRRARGKLAKKCGFDLRRIVENARQGEVKNLGRVLTAKELKRIKRAASAA